MGNKLSKSLISVSGAMTVVLGVMGLKFQKEAGDVKILKENLQSSLVAAEKVENMMDVQNKMEADRMENLQKVDNAQIGTKTETKVQTTVIPGKTVSQTSTKVTSSGGSKSSSKSSSSSSSSKTTKSS